MSKASTEKNPDKMPSLLLTICLITGATLFANFLAAVSSALLSPLFHSQSDWEVMIDIVEYSLGPVIPFVSFLIPSILATVYVFPIYRICCSKRLDAEIVKGYSRFSGTGLTEKI